MNKYNARIRKFDHQAVSIENFQKGTNYFR